MNSDLAQEIRSHSAVELIARLRRRELSPVEVFAAFRAAIEAENPRLNAFVTLNENGAAEAARIEAKILRGDTVGGLYGLPVSVKDTFDTAGMLTTGGAKPLANNVPTRDAGIVRRLKENHAVILGKTNPAEMAAAYESDNAVLGRTINLYDAERTAGGSSGGEAAAVAARLSPVGIGSDLMGSVRVPANFCGIYGLKPTSGNLPLDGHMPNADGALSLGASAGILTRVVEDAELLYELLRRRAPGESFSLNEFQRFNAPPTDLRNTGFAVVAADEITPIEDEIETALTNVAATLTAAGLTQRATQTAPYFVAAQREKLWFRLFGFAAYRETARIYAQQETSAGETVKAILAAQHKRAPQTLEDFQAAWLRRDELRAKLTEAMQRESLLLMPVGATSAFTHGAQTVEVRGEKISLMRAFSYSQLINVFGLPALAIPCGRSKKSGLPVGIQLVGRPHCEVELFAAAGLCARQSVDTAGE